MQLNEYARRVMELMATRNRLCDWNGPYVQRCWERGMSVLQCVEAA